MCVKSKKKSSEGHSLSRLGCATPAPQPLSSAGRQRLWPWKKDNLQNSKAQSTSFHKSVKELSENNAIVYRITNKPKCLKASKLILRTFINLTQNIYYTNLQQLRIQPFTLIHYKPSTLSYSTVSILVQK